MKKTFGFFCILFVCLAFFSGFFVYSFADEEKKLDVQIINNNQEVLYLNLINVSGVYNYNNGIYILDSDNAYFVENGNSTQHTLEIFEQVKDDILLNHFGGIYLESGANYSSFYTYIEQEKVYLLTGIEDVRDYSYNISTDTLMILTDIRVLIYNNIVNEKPVKIKEFAVNKGLKLCFNDEFIFIGKKNSVVKIEYNLEEIVEKEFIASNSSADYFYYCPNSVFTRGENIFISDLMNDRVAILSTSISYLTYNNPISTASTLNGQIIVAHSNNEITNHDTKKTIEIRINSRPVLIKKIAISLEDEIIILCEFSSLNYLFKTDINLEDYTLLDSFINPLSIGYKVGGTVLVYDDGAIKTLDNQILLSCQPVIDFHLDYADKVYAINTQNQLICIDNESEINYGGRFSKLFISNTSNAFVTFNDLLLLDEGSHSLYKVGNIGIENVSDYYNVSDEIANGNSLHTSQFNILAKAKNDTYLFSLAIESSVVSIINNGQTVFIRHDIDAPNNMYFALIETQNSLKWGYVYKSSIDTSAFQYNAPEILQGKLIASCPVYKYPSIYASVAKTYSLNQTVRLLEFADDYLDIDSKQWLRIEVNGLEGYIKTQNVSLSLFSSQTPPLKVNASIKNTTILYVKTADGMFEPYDAYMYIEKDTMVVVETPFDSTNQYTKILFYIDDKVLDLDCYVLTSEIDYKGVDTVQFIAICVIVITLVLVVLITIMLSKKSKRKVNE